MTTSPTTETTELDVELAGFKRTDYGNAERLVARHGQDLRYCHQTGDWLVWDGTRWLADHTGETMRHAKNTVRALYREAGTLDNEESRAAHGKHAAYSESASRLKGMLELARSERRISADIADFDRDPWLFNVANGTLDLRRATFRDHCRDDLLTRRSEVVYDREAKCPRWLQFLDEVFDDQATVDYVQKVFGYALTGDVSDQTVFILHGDGANGKTTLLNLLLQLAGDYGMQAAPDLLLAERKDTHPTALADLQGRRPVVASEVNEGAFFNEQLLKSLAGGELIRARRMRQDYYSFPPTHTLFLAVNHLPNVRGRDEGIWRRLRVLPFPNQFSREVRDPRLGEQLTHELPGILNWAFEGARRWVADGHLGPPASIVAQAEGYRVETDPLAGFVDECCTRDPNARTAVQDLYGAYQVWHRHSGEGSPLSGRAFGLQLKRLGFTKVKSGIVYREGLALLPQYTPPLF